MAKNQLKESFAVESRHGSFYTGGQTVWLQDTLYCQSDNEINGLDVQSGAVRKVLQEAKDDEVSDTMYTFDVDSKRIVSTHKSGLLKLWDLETGVLVKVWKYIHKGPVFVVVLWQDGLVATGGSDGVVRLWNLTLQNCMFALKGQVQGVVNLVKFHHEEPLIFLSADDGSIACYNPKTGNLQNTFKGHFGKVIELQTIDKARFVSLGRDNVMILWNLKQQNPLKSIALNEPTETLMFLREKPPIIQGHKEISLLVATGGSKLQVWNVLTSKIVHAQATPGLSKLLGQKQGFCGVTTEQNILLYDLSLNVVKQFCGFCDVILDVVFVGDQDEWVAVATNSKVIKLYNSKMNCYFLTGHEDFVLGLDTCQSNRQLFASCSKDKTIKLWVLKEPEGASCVATTLGHTSSISSVRFAHNSLQFYSVAQDFCLKSWSFHDNKVVNLKSQIAHSKDVNCVALSPNDKLVATASQDKSVKIWSSDTLSLIGVLQGHKRGVWFVQFSPVDQVLVSSSADCTIKLWSVSDLTCLKTYQNLHDSSILRVQFISNGLQLITCAADGLIKLLALKTQEVQTILDEHSQRVWTLAISQDESTLISGGDDSQLIKWKDVSEKLQETRRKQLEEETLQEQALNNFLQNEQFLQALQLALKLNKPLNTLKIIQGIVKNKSQTSLVEVLEQIKQEEKEQLLKLVLRWNTNTKNCQVAQLVLNSLINNLQKQKLKLNNLRGCLEQALPYTDRHFQRLGMLCQDMHFLDYTLSCMETTYIKQE